MESQSMLNMKREKKQEVIDLIDDWIESENENDSTEIGNHKNQNYNNVELGHTCNSNYPSSIGSPIYNSNMIPIKSTLSLNERKIDKKTISKVFDNDFIPFDSLEPSKIPWITEDVVKSKGKVRLHYEILSFYEYIKPKDKDNSRREKTFNEIKSALSVNSHWEVHLFGSYGTNLHLPDSDIDIVVINKGYNMSNFEMLRSIKKILEFNDLVEHADIINSNIPIIRAISKNNKIYIDISVNKSNSIQVKEDINKALLINPHLPPIIYFLKYFLKQRGLNSTYTGGISSFLLFNMVFAFNTLYKERSKKSYILLSNFLIDFFSFYAYDFNYKEIGISIRENGYFFKKTSNKNTQLCVENYLENNIDIGKLCYVYESKIIKVFKTARNGLLYPESVKDSYLSNILLPANQE